MNYRALWRPEEDKILYDNTDLYPADMEKLIPGRTKKSIEQRMQKLGGSKVFRTKKEWTEAEIKALSYMWASFPFSEIRKRIPRHKQRDLTKKAKELGLERLKMNPRQDNVSWPGLEGGREAYGMSRAEHRKPPPKPPKDESTTVHPAVQKILDLFS